MKTDIFHNRRLIFFDGAMGTMLHGAGLKSGELPEACNMTHPEVIEGIHRAYLEAGSDVITTNTFGANSLKLNPLGYTPEEIVKAAVNIAKKAAGHDGLVALDVGPLGQLMAPMGTLTFQDAYDLFVPQVQAGQEAGADLILIETMSDLYEAKAAILAAKEHTQLPVICTLTFQKNGRTLMGNDPITALTVLEGLGVDALGVNCSLGPEDLLSIVKQFAENSHVPVLVQANAGLPELVDGRPVFPLTPERFADWVEKMIPMGVKMIGGCCGTNPDFIRELRKRLRDYPYAKRANPRRTAASSARQTVFFDDGFRIVGQRINPTGREDLADALRSGDLDALYDEAILQKQAGADILDVNVYAEGIDERSTMSRAVEYIQSMLPIPLQLDSRDCNALEAGVRVYNGKPIINSVNGRKESMEKIFPIARKYGACVIGMTMDESGIPAKAEDRLAIARKIVETAAEYGVPKEDILIDCLVLSAAHEPLSARETLKAVALVKAELGVKTILGISNISYGMKERSALNGTFLAMALGAGLDSAIVDPTSGEIRKVLEIYDVLSKKNREQSN